ncbi:hypothetical protein OROMI_003761 [Orobanche minor]
MLLGYHLEENNVGTRTSPPEQATEFSVGKADMLDTESTSSFSWNTLSSLHHTENSSSTEQSEDEMNKALESLLILVVLFYFRYLAKQIMMNLLLARAAEAFIKFSLSRMATQSERLGYEFAKWLGVQTPQARVIHNASPEWLQIKEAAEKTKDAASAEGDEIVEMTCSELSS